MSINMHTSKPIITVGELVSILSVFPLDMKVSIVTRGKTVLFFNENGGQIARITRETKVVIVDDSANDSSI